MENITWKEFEKIELRVGTIIGVNDFPEALKPAYKLTIDFGSQIGIRRSSAQITSRYSKSELMGKHIIGVINFPPKQIGPFMSECLVTGFSDGTGGIILATTDTNVINGSKLF